MSRGPACKFLGSFPLPARWPPIVNNLSETAKCIIVVASSGLPQRCCFQKDFESYSIDFEGRL